MNPLHDELAQRPPHHRERLGPRRLVHQQLRHHRVVVRRHPVAGHHVRVQPHAGAARRPPRRDHPGARAEVGVHVLGVHPHLDRRPAVDDVLLLERQLLPRRHADLLADQVYAGHQFRHRVLDLDAGVHLDEVELVVAVHEELARPGRVVPGRLRQPHRTLAHGDAHRVRQVRRRRLLHQLLVAALERAVALEQVDHVAVLVAQQLHLDVPRAVEVLFQEDAAVLERRLGLGARRRQPLDEPVVVPRLPHPLAAAAGRRLDEHRVADLVREVERLLLGLDEAVAAGDGGDVRGLRHDLRPGLVAELVHGLGRRADELELVVAAHLRELAVLAEEPEPGVDGVGVHALGRGDDARHLQVALGGDGRADAHRLVGELEVRRVLVGFRVDDGDLDAEVAAGADDAEGDLTPVGDEHFAEHAWGCPGERPARAGWSG